MIALATQSDLPDWEVDDSPFHAALADFGIDAALVAWDDRSVDWSRYDAVVIRTTWDYTAKHEAFVAWADSVESVTKLYNPADVVRWNTRKTYLRELESRGVPIVPTEWVLPGERREIAEIVERHEWERGFMKPVIGSTAEATLRFDRTDLAAAQRHLDELAAKSGAMVQPYLASVESDGECSIVLFDGEFSHAVRKVPVAGDYRVQDDFGASDAAHEASAEERDLARRAVAASGFEDLLYARVDYLRDDSGDPRLVELELVEPSLFFRHDATAARRFAEAVRSRLA